MSRRILVAASHPDDEVLGCGGTMAAHVDRGDEVFLYIGATGASSRHTKGSNPASEIQALRRSARKAGDILGVSEMFFGDFPDNRMDSVDLLDVVQAVETVLGQVKPDVVYTHFGGDMNVDHQVLSKALLTAARPQPGESVAAIYCFEVSSSTEWAFGSQGRIFEPNVFVDIEASLERKLEALKAYASEMRPFPHARSLEAVEAQARRRGVQVGLAAAEAFVLARAVCDASALVGAPR